MYSAEATETLHGLNSSPWEAQDLFLGRMRVETLGFIFFFFLSAKIFLTFLLFRSRPALGTLFESSFICLTAATCLILVGMYQRFYRRRVAWPVTSKLMAVFLCWVGVTIAWARVDSVPTTVAYWVVVSLQIVCIFLLVRISNLELLAIRSFQGFVWGSVAVCLVAFLTVGGADRLGDEELFHPNMIGNHLGLTILVCMHLIAGARRSSATRYVWIASLIIFLVALTRTFSKTSILACAISAVVFLMRSNAALKSKLALAFVMLAVLLACYPIFVSQLNEYSQESQGTATETLSGRTVLWAATWEMIKQRPILGYGFMSFRISGPQTFSVRVVHAHNQYLHIWFSEGAVGLLLGILMYGSFVRQALTSMRLPSLSARGTLGFCIFLYAFICGLTEARDSLIFPEPLFFLLSVWMPSVASLAPLRWGKTLKTRLA